MNNVEFNNMRFSRAESPNIKKQNLSFNNPAVKISKTPTKANCKPNEFRMQRIVMNTDVKLELNMEKKEDGNDIKINDLKNFRKNKSGLAKKFVPFDKAESYIDGLLRKK
jgi:hypothetical protein